LKKLIVDASHFVKSGLLHEPNEVGDGRKGCAALPPNARVQWLSHKAHLFDTMGLNDSGSGAFRLVMPATLSKPTDS
jgi:hypothetical protein